MKNILNSLKSHRFTILAVFVGLLSAITAIGCTAFQSRTASPTNPTQRVTRPQLKAEATAFAAKVQAAEADLDTQDLVKQQILSVVTAATDKFVPAEYSQILSGVLGAIAIGATVDNVRVRRKSGSDPEPSDPSTPADPEPVAEAGAIQPPKA
jgi:hypothetical protein